MFKLNRGTTPAHRIVMVEYSRELRYARNGDENHHWRSGWRLFKSKPQRSCYCGKRIDHPIAKTCSRTCATRRFQASRIDAKDCLQCGKQFTGISSQIKKRKYCSTACENLYKRTHSQNQTHCAKCGSEFKYIKIAKGRRLCATCRSAAKRYGPINTKIANTLRRRIIHVVKGQKSAPTFALLGCDINQFRAHLESQFKRGMTWENHGRIWHIDHREPCASFDLSNPEEQRRCFHFSNLQPLRARENMTKGCRIVPTQRELLISL